MTPNAPDLGRYPSGGRAPGRREGGGPGLGVRGGEKAATRQALHEAAMRLALANGFESITVEAVADAAGVSRRTFSNYFANKEEALLYGDQQRVRGLIASVRARPAAEPAWTALTRAARESWPACGLDA